MSEELPAPLVPAEVDLRDFGFMPLDVRTLLTSTLWIKAKKDPRVAHAAMSLWCESWHQVPCASLPDDDEVLADLARCDEKEWKRVKERALAHFVKCSDGRLYHRTVAAKAVESWKSKVAQRERTKKATEARQAKQREQHGPPDDHRDEERHEQRDVQRDESRDVHQGTVKGEGIDTPIAPKGASKAGAVSLRTWVDAIKAKGEKPIPPGDPVLAYADKVALPREYLVLAWQQFLHTYTTSRDAKRYRDWRKVFRNAVEANWLKLWFLAPDGTYSLTTVGHQAQRAHDDRKAA